MSQQVRLSLSAKDIPSHWYNLQVNFTQSLPPPPQQSSQQPVMPEMMTAIFSENLVRQEMSVEKWIEISGEVPDIYQLYRRSQQMPRGGQETSDSV